MSDLHRAHTLYLSGDLEAADELLAHAPDYATSFLVRAEILAATGEPAEALRYAERAVELCPNSPRAILLVESLRRLESVRRARNSEPTKEPTLSELFDDELPGQDSGFPIPDSGQRELPEPDSAEERADNVITAPESGIRNPESDPDPEVPGLVSETLAKLLVKQGKIAEAKKVYIQLSRKYPERYDYFRNRMDALQPISEAGVRNADAGK